MGSTVVVDLGYGDSGKGTTVDWLCRQRKTAEVIRFNGSCQAGHNVVMPDGTHHCFSQFGSGTLAGVPTFLSRFMVVDPLRIADEALHLEQLGLPHALDLMSIDAEAVVVTPYHTAAQQFREEARGEDRHGSCGTGFGEAVNYHQLFGHALQMKDLGTPRGGLMLQEILDYYREQFPNIKNVTPSFMDILEAYSACAARMLIVDGKRHLRRRASRGELVFEGAQGVLLDQDYGFHPYTTWSSTTYANADQLLDDAGLDRGYHVGVLRSYSVRHGPGPFVPEADFAFEEPHNQVNKWQGRFRAGHFDAVAATYAIRACAEAGGAVDGLAITHLDRTEHIGLYVDAYIDPEDRHERHKDLRVIDPTLLGNRRHHTEWVERCVPRYANFPHENQAVCIATLVGIPEVQMASWGPTSLDKYENVIIPKDFQDKIGRSKRSLTS